MDILEVYRIEVQGHLDSSWRDAFGMEILIEDDDPPVTSLTGVVDQAALHGALNKLYSIGLPLISVSCR
jgi:hypothetical protein